MSTTPPSPTDGVAAGPGFRTSMRRPSVDLPANVQLVGAVVPELEQILSREALEFLAELSRRFDPRRRELLQTRGRFRQRISEGQPPDFLPETRTLRDSDWKIPPPPADLRDRRVEITGPVDRKMIINALNSGAKVYMADFEDSHAPTWAATVQGQANLSDAVLGTIEFRNPEGRRYRLNRRHATLMVRPRGWHLEERHLLVDRKPISASLFDFGLFFFRNARPLVARGSGPYFYLAKIEHYAEAALWDDVFRMAEARIGLPVGTIRATALIETLPAVFEMDEILFALREHSAGLNCGRWDYIFSFIKQFRDDPTAVFPDRALLPMTTPFLDAYSRLVVRTCHRRGAHAIGGMAAQIPIRNDPARNATALAQVIVDKEREVKVGHDGTWVAHPGLVAVAQQVFDAAMPTPNQIDAPSGGPPISASELLQIPRGPVTLDGARTNVRVALRYLESWFRGIGCVPIDHLMEDAATVEIARAQLWQWIRHDVRLQNGPTMTSGLFRTLLEEELTRLQGESGRVTSKTASLIHAKELLDAIVTGKVLLEFFTLEACETLDTMAEGGDT